MIKFYIQKHVELPPPYCIDYRPYTKIKMFQVTKRFFTSNKNSIIFLNNMKINQIFWDRFYKNNSITFKDRHYLKIFPELNSKEVKILEVGYGVGNSLFPLLEFNSKLNFYSFDFSATAIEILKVI